MISEAYKRVGRKGMVRIENGRGTVNSLEIIEGMEFERGYLSPCFVTNHATMSIELTDCKILLVDKKITDPRDLLRVCFSAVKDDFPLLIIAEDVEEEALATLTRNKLSGMIRVAAVKAFSFGEQKTQCLEDIAIMTGVLGTVVRDDMGYTLEEAGKEVHCSIIQAAIDEGVVVGGGCSLLRLSMKIDIIKESLDNVEQKVGADIFKHALSYPTTMIANNAGMSGKFVIEKVLSNDNASYGYNAATNCYEDLVAGGIMDPTKGTLLLLPSLFSPLM